MAEKPPPPPPSGVRGMAPIDPGHQGESLPSGVSGAAAVTWTAIHHARALIENWALAGAGKVGALKS